MIDYGYGQSEIAVGDAFIKEPDIRKVLQGIKDIGGSRVRFLAAWDLLNPPSAPSTYNWVEMDRAMKLCAEYGIRPLPCVGLGYGKGGDGSPASYANTCKELAIRYGPSGTKQIYEIEIFNEENSSLNFQPNNPASYTQFLKAASTAIKSVHSSCTVVIGGPIQTADVPFIIIPVLTPPFFIIGSAVNPVSWIKGIYDAGGKDYFDACAVHYYAPSTPGSDSDYQWKYILGIRDLMVAQGDGAKKLWVTEVGAAYPGNPTLVATRDLLKQQIELLQTLPNLGPIYIYSYRDASPNVDGNSVFGMVDYNFVPKSPVYEYARTIAGTGTPSTGGGGGGGGGGGDVTPPDPPTWAITAVSNLTPTSASLQWNANPVIDGVTNYRLYTQSGARVTDTTELFTPVDDLQPNAVQKFYLTAVDQAGNESLPSALQTVTTPAAAGLQEYFQQVFTGSIVPASFAQLGVGFGVSGGFALHNAPTSDGKYWTVEPYFLNMRSQNHSCRVSLAAQSAGPDRGVMAVVRCSPDGQTWVAAVAVGGAADSLQIVTSVAGVVTVRAAKTATPATGNQDLMMSVDGSTYTARIVDSSTATVVVELSWTDIDGVYPGIANVRTAIGWRHLRVHGINYPAPRITKWRAVDLFAVSALGTDDGWPLGVLDADACDEFLATNMWESLI